MKVGLFHSYGGGAGAAHLGRGTTWGNMTVGPEVAIGVVCQARLEGIYGENDEETEGEEGQDGAYDKPGW